MAPTISTSQLSYTLAGLLAPQPHRLDGRSLLQFRPLHISTGFAPQAAGSAQASLDGSTRCSVVVSADVVEESEAANVNGLISSTVDCAPSVPSSTSLAALLVTLQKALLNALLPLQSTGEESSLQGIDPAQLVILRSIRAPHISTRAWRLHVDVEFNDVSGGNLADVMFSAVFAALNDVRLPRTRAIGFDIAQMYGKGETSAEAGDAVTDADGTGKSNLDIFNTKGTRGRAQRSAAATRNRHQKMSAAGIKDQAVNPEEAASLQIGVDFEMEDQWDAGKALAGASTFPIGITLNLLGNNRTLLDATLTEEACLPTSRRLLVLCRPTSPTSAASAAGIVAGTFTLGATLDVGSSRTGESDDADLAKQHAGGQVQNAKMYGTCAYVTISAAIKDGYRHALGLHAAIEAQLASKQS